MKNTQLLSREEICELPTLERQKHVEKLRVFYPTWNTIYQKIERCHRRNAISAEPQGFLFVGRPRAGKTTLLASYHQHYPRQRIQNDDGSFRTLVPIVRTIVPAKATVPNLIRFLGRALGDPLGSSTGTQGQMETRLMDLFVDSGVQMLMLDELQHFVDRDSWKVLLSASNWLKAFIKELKIACILAGLEEEAEQVVNANSQLQSLFGKPYKLEPFEWDTQLTGGDISFRSLIHSIEELLPLKDASNLASDDTDTAWRCYVASGGLMGYLMELLRTATHLALEQGHECLDHELLSAAFTDRLSNIREIPNPFEGARPSFEPLPDITPRIIRPKKDK
jgi:hypothetical protein